MSGSESADRVEAASLEVYATVAEAMRQAGSATAASAPTRSLGGPAE
jgi:hypothetical protein